MTRKWLLVVTVALGLGTAYRITAAPAPGVSDQRTESYVLKTSFGFPDEAASPATVSVSTAAARTATNFPAGFNQVRVFCTADAYYKFGDSSVAATTSSTPLPAKVPEVVSTGGYARVSFILSAGTGTCWATVMK